MYQRTCVILFGILMLFTGQTVLAQSSSCEEIGRVTSAQGLVRVQHNDSEQWERLERDSTICEGDTIQTGIRSRAAVNLDNETVMRIKAKSTTTVENISARSEAQSLFRMLSGVIHFFSRKPQEYAISTTTATIGIRGTEFVVSVAENQTDLTVFEGAVQAQNDVGPITLTGGETVTIVDGQTAQKQTLVKPRELVQWGLYYPPVLAVGDDDDDGLGGARQCVQEDDFECAFEAMDQVPAASRGSRYQTYLASLLLAVGEVEAAESALQQVQDTDNAEAAALAAIIALTQNRGEDALASAQQAVGSEPGSAAALIALSYVQQADLQLEAARDTLLTAVEQNAENPLAWARLSEVQLALGHRREARDAAARAVALNPNLARTQMVLGYAALSEIDTDSAKSAFNRALDLDSADPLAHLGLGLSLIREGDLVAGRREIETAVALDSSSAVLRPYLGRAYFEEKRAPLDADQYAIAKELDPNDPTAYLFDALRLHSENRPVEAARELDQSIALNDNRAVYRGRNLLDQDRAARGASLARNYDTLGFTERGVNEATNSLAIDPGNASAHRFLSDSYQQVRRREISRVSELLQAQMLQDINSNPVQPSVSAVNLNLGVGAGDVGLNEFSGLFESNGVQPAISVFGGSNDTTGAEAVLSGVYDSLSFSIGAFDYESDGWRDNNDQDQELGNVFVQWAASPQLNLQAEISTSESSEGDLAFNFDPDSFDPTLRKEKEFDSERVGLRYSPTPDADILVSHIESEREEDSVAKLIGVPAITSFTVIGPPPIPPIVIPNIELVDYDSDIQRDDDGSQSEIQYLQRAERFNLVAGLFSAEIDTETDTLLEAPPEVLVPIVPELDTTTETTLEHERAYVYVTFQPVPAVDLTVGVSNDDYDDEVLTESLDETNAKLGLRWRIDDRQTFRLAALEVMKPSLANNRLLEPTQVAGFNQFFDDVNGTQTELVGLGYDIRLSKTVHAGIELTSREMEIPFRFIDINPPFGESTEFEEQEEELGRLYLYWTPSNTVALSAEIISDTFEAPDEADVNTPVEAETRSLPVSVKYFSPSGWFAGIRTTFVDQEIERNEISTLAGGDEDFEVIDLSFGYRLPRRLGSISLEVQNAADEEFNYQDDSYREFRDEPSTGPFFPERTTFIRANLVF